MCSLRKMVEWTDLEMRGQVLYTECKCQWHLSLCKPDNLCSSLGEGPHLKTDRKHKEHYLLSLHAPSTHQPASILHPASSPETSVSP